MVNLRPGVRKRGRFDRLAKDRRPRKGLRNLRRLLNLGIVFDW